MKKYWIPITVGIVCAVVFFCIGMAVGKGSSTTARTGFAGRGAYGSSTFAGRGGTGGGFVSGQVVSVSSSSIMVSLANGNSEVVLYSGSTSIVKPTDVSASVLTPGTMVMIGGATNSDGSVTASTIQVRTATSTYGGGAAAGAGATGNAPMIPAGQ